MNRGSRSRNMLLTVGFLLCLGLSGCLLPMSNRPPVVVLEVLPREGYVPLEVVFDASGSFDPESEALTIQWDFGDGETAAGSTVTHSYQSAGDYQARVTVIDPEGEAT
ncbi:MAG: PKD domain-containing protein, partial [Candidatus Bipolaricaulota bacterium]